MVEEFNLSEKRKELFDKFKVGLGIRGVSPAELLILIDSIEKQDKEFIKLLLEGKQVCVLKSKIHKLAGDKLE